MSNPNLALAAVSVAAAYPATVDLFGVVTDTGSLAFVNSPELPSITFD